MPNTGPSDGSRSAMTAFLPIFAIAWPSPAVVVVLPSPAGVGLIAVTRISFPSGPSFRREKSPSLSFALKRPYGSSSSSRTPSSRAISAMGLSLCLLGNFNIRKHFDIRLSLHLRRPPPRPVCSPGGRGARSCDFCFDYSSKRGIRKGILFLSQKFEKDC